LFYWGTWALMTGAGLYFAAVILSIGRLLILQPTLLKGSISRLLWISGLPTTIGVILIAVDLAIFFPLKRGLGRKAPSPLGEAPLITVALTAYNDELSIGAAVKDFLSHSKVKRVIVVSNASQDRTMEFAQGSGAIVINEERQGYGRCCYRCLEEAARWSDTELVALCEGDMTFRAADLDKLIAYMSHAEIVNGTRIVEQLREPKTQLTTFMYYGNFFAGKLLEAKHLGQGTFTDVGTTYKMVRRTTIPAILPIVDPSINLEFNAHFLDTALKHEISIVECPVTFHARLGFSKGGNVNNFRALKVGLRIIWGLTFGWGLLA
jgi:glycosyltransferase involved in cell wall biosynthesis